MYHIPRSRKLQKYMRKLGKSQIRFEKYVKEFYIENDLAYISCNVKGYDDIIDSFSVEGYEWLDERFTRFFESNAEYIPVEYPIVLEICGANFTEKQKRTIEETFRDYYALKMGDAQLEIEENNKKGIFLLIIGILAAILVYLSNSVETSLLIAETALILFWLFIEDALDILIIDGGSLREEKVYAAQLANTKIRFQTVFEDVPDSELDREEIFEEALEGPDEEPFYDDEENEEDK